MTLPVLILLGLTLAASVASLVVGLLVLSRLRDAVYPPRPPAVDRRELNLGPPREVGERRRPTPGPAPAEAPTTVQDRADATPTEVVPAVRRRRHG